MNYYDGSMSSDYGELRNLLDKGYVVVCYVNYLYRTGERTVVFRDVAKAKSNDRNPNTQGYGYTVEARGIIYLSWDRSMETLRGMTFEQMCEDLKLEWICLT